MTTNSRRPLFATLAGIALAAAASYGAAASPRDADAATGAPSPQVVSLQSPRAEAGAPRATAPLTLHVQDASGNARRLVHVPGIGWEYERGWRGSDPLQKSARQTRATSSAGTSGDDMPLTVFIDGPSGFTYVWNRDDGWTCIGRLVDDAL